LNGFKTIPFLKEPGTSIFGPFTNDFPILPFEYEYRFTEDEYEYEKNQWYELPATVMPDLAREIIGYAEHCGIHDRSVSTCFGVFSGSIPNG
jgi:hypothetical protein